MKDNWKLSVLTFAYVASATSLAGATVTTRPLTLAEIADKSDGAFLGTLRAKTSAADKKTGFVWTLYTFEVEETLAGTFPGNTAKFRCAGGTADGRAMRVVGVPVFEIGERVLAFLKVGGSTLCEIYGWSEGAFRVRKDERGHDIFVGQGGKAVASIGLSGPILTNAKVVRRTSEPMPSEFEPIRTLVGGDVQVSPNVPAGPPAALGAILPELRLFARSHSKSAKTVSPTTTVMGSFPSTSAGAK